MHSHNSTWHGGTRRAPNLRQRHDDNEGIALKTEEDDTDTTKPMRATKRLFAIQVVPRASIKDEVDTDNEDNEDCRENRRS